MKINKKNAIALWEECYGAAIFAEDFHGYLMCKYGYGNDDYFITEGFERIYCGWNIHHILPASCGGTNAKSNLLCTNIATNEIAEDKITYWIDDCKYQVRKDTRNNGYEIVRIE